MIKCYQKSARWCNSNPSHKGPFIGLTVEYMEGNGHVGNSLGLCLNCAKDLQVKLGKTIAVAHLKSLVKK